MQRGHVISARQFDRASITEIFESADEMEMATIGGGRDLLAKHVMATLFYEPSTRTRLSFESAMVRLGGRYVSTENAREYSSVAKGETLEDTIRTVSQLADVIVLRHYEAGAAERAAKVSGHVPIINAGDGVGEHPSQALLDLYTIKKQGPAGLLEDGVRIALVGDLANGRTVHSLARLAANFAVKEFIFVAPEAVRMKDDIKRELAERGIAFVEEDDLAKAVETADVVYMTRIQKERFGDRVEDYEASRGRYVIDRAIMARMKERALLMHPLPRVGEIDPEVDGDPRSVYFQQVRYGLYIRMALLVRAMRLRYAMS